MSDTTGYDGARKNTPVVQGFSNRIYLDFKENAFYVGSAYVGSEKINTKVVFDTRTKWSGIILPTASNADNPSTYDLQTSTTAVPYLPRGHLEHTSLTLDLVSINGNVYRDALCLQFFPVKE